eukprot:gene6785-4867_t
MKYFAAVAPPRIQFLSARPRGVYAASAGCVLCGHASPTLPPSPLRIGPLPHQRTAPPRHSPSTMPSELIKKDGQPVHRIPPRPESQPYTQYPPPHQNPMPMQHSPQIHQPMPTSQRNM